MRTLVVEGGGMRGAYAAGALVALEDAGERFDAIYASSSGACSAAYLAAGQREGVSIWHDHLDGAKFIGIRNLLRGRTYLDLDYLVDDVFAQRVPFDAARLRASPTPLWISLTRASDGQACYRDLRREASPLQALRATAALPVAYGKPVMLEGESYLDGGIADPIPLRRALEGGGDDVTVILTRPRGYRRAPSSQAVVRFAMRPYPGATIAMATMHERYNDALDLIERPPDDTRIRAIAPPPSLRLSRLMRGADDLRRAVAQGMLDARRQLG